MSVFGNLLPFYGQKKERQIQVLFIGQVAASIDLASGLTSSATSPMAHWGHVNPGFSPLKIETYT